MIFRSLSLFLDFLNCFKYRNDLLRQHGSIMMSPGQPGLFQVKPDMWGPHISNTGLVSVADRWA